MSARGRLSHEVFNHSDDKEFNFLSQGVNSKPRGRVSKGKPLNNSSLLQPRGSVHNHGRQLTVPALKRAASNNPTVNNVSADDFKIPRKRKESNDRRANSQDFLNRGQDREQGTSDDILIPPSQRGYRGNSGNEVSKVVSRISARSHVRAGVTPPSSGKRRGMLGTDSLATLGVGNIPIQSRPPSRAGRGGNPRKAPTAVVDLCGSEEDTSEESIPCSRREAKKQSNKIQRSDAQNCGSRVSCVEDTNGIKAQSRAEGALEGYECDKGNSRSDKTSGPTSSAHRKRRRNHLEQKNDSPKNLKVSPAGKAETIALESDDDEKMVHNQLGRQHVMDNVDGSREEETLSTPSKTRRRIPESDNEDAPDELSPSQTEAAITQDNYASKTFNDAVAVSSVLDVGDLVVYSNSPVKQNYYDTKHIVDDIENGDVDLTSHNSDLKFIKKNCQKRKFLCWVCGDFSNFLFRANSFCPI